MNARFRPKRHHYIAAACAGLLLIAAGILVCSSPKEEGDDIYSRAVMRDYRVYSPVIPDTLTFAGESIPLSTYYVREALDNELIINMYRQSSTVLYFKRANRYFPVIEPILKKNGIPIDFKYLCVIESGLTNATSPAKAQGFWQFIPSTGSKYGLEITDEIDMRDNLVASTEAACKYIRTLYNRFHSWTAAAAAYNCGENGLSRRIEKQGSGNYFDLWLNSETSRYVYRILAMKVIMQNPRQYGYCMRHCDLYPPIPTRTATLSGKNVDLYAFARANKTTYKMLRTLNPWIKTDVLKNKADKTYTVLLPVENGTRHSTLTKGRKNTEMITSI
ncbi:MAG: lytic transglycosylase domain-containing protein [Bacteroidales bacterium]|nr:lytic transglycosylase domain-containing protein [Bacteroidales bacterium]